MESSASCGKSSESSQLGTVAHQVVQVYQSGAVVRKQTFSPANAPAAQQVECYSGLFRAVVGNLQPGKMIKLRFQVKGNHVAGLFHSDMLAALAKMCEEAMAVLANGVQAEGLEGAGSRPPH